MPRPIPELLAPAGTPEKLKTALHFGADAVYLGLKRFSMRSFAGNFDFDQLAWALDYAHQRGKRVHVAVNVQPFDEELADLEETFRTLGKLDPDGVIVGDAGVLSLARSLAPRLPLHLSTQASVTNVPAARFWFAQGIERIIVARELSLEQLASLTRAVDGEIETFVHGAVCMAFSGRCFLSLYWAGRDPRHGACAQGCRWPYKEIEDRRRPGMANQIAEDERGTYFFDAKDLCALPVLDALVDTGVRALKIEGRTRSEYYVGVVVDVYRRALDALREGDLDAFHSIQAQGSRDLESTGKRGFSTHFLTGRENCIESYNPDGSPLGGRHDFLGKVAQAHADHLVVSLQNPLRPGVVIEVWDRASRRFRVAVGEVRGVDGALLDFGRERQDVRIMTTVPAEPGALVRIVQEHEGNPIG
jgi:U32 family peptidase